MKLVFERFDEWRSTPGNHKGNWVTYDKRNVSPMSARNICYNSCMKTRQAWRIVNPFNGATLMTCKYNPPGKVVTTYNSPSFEDLIVGNAVENSRERE